MWLRSGVGSDLRNRITLEFSAEDFGRTAEHTNLVRADVRERAVWFIFLNYRVTVEAMMPRFVS